jgi:FkbM family methyltransferase
VLKRIYRKIKYHKLAGIGKITQIASFANEARNGRHYLADNDTILTTLYTGQIIAVDRTDISLTPHLVLKGEWEMELTRICELIIQTMSAPIILDIGANVGWYGLVLSRFTPSATVHFFEANPTLTKLLKKSVLVNGLALRSTINQNAVSNASGQSLTLSIPEMHKGSASTSGFNVDLSLFHEESSAIQRIKVPTISIDDYRLKHSLPTVDFMKLDVEGAEDHVLLGSENTIRSSESLVIMMEWNRGQYSPDLLAILKMFSWCGCLDNDGLWQDLSEELHMAESVMCFEEMVATRAGQSRRHFDLFFGKQESVAHMIRDRLT